MALSKGCLQNLSMRLGFRHCACDLHQDRERDCGGCRSPLGQKAAVPGIGACVSIDPQAGDSPRPSYFVLIDASNTRRNELWIRENQLLKGASLEAAVPYQDDDFVLYSIVHGSDEKHALHQPPLQFCRWLCPFSRYGRRSKWPCRGWSLEERVSRTIRLVHNLDR
jgi:hypothetical protein